MLDRKHYVILFLSGLLFVGCARPKGIEPGILKEMAGLDRLYVPALVFTDLGKQMESELALESYRRQWNKFYAKYHGRQIKYGLDITDKFWSEDFDRVNSLILSAEALVKERQLGEAHGDLDEVSKILKELRHRHGLKYILDALTEFHGYLDEISFLVEGGEDLREDDLLYLKQLFTAAQTSWAEIAQSEYDLKIFGFGPEKNEAIKGRVAEQEKFIEQLSAALSLADRDKIAQAASQLESNFILIIKAFGDFEPVFIRARKGRGKLEISEKKLVSKEAVTK